MNIREEISGLELGYQEGNYDICHIKEGHAHLLPTGIDKILDKVRGRIKAAKNPFDICSGADESEIKAYEQAREDFLKELK